MIQLINALSLYWGKLSLIFAFIFLIYLFMTLVLIYLIFRSLRKNLNRVTQIEYISLIKDKDFILFKDSLFRLYGSISIVLFIFLFRNGELAYLLNLNIFVFLILILLILISKTFILFLFKFYLNLQACIKVLNEINFNPLDIKNKYNSSKLSSLYLNTRSFSTSSRKNSNDFELDPQMESLPNS